MSYSSHRYNSSGNPYYTGITVPWPGYPGTVAQPWPLTTADLDAYFATSLNGAAWFALDFQTQTAALAEAQRWLATLCWNKEGCCGKDFESALLMATAELALALATNPSAVIGPPADGRWTKREKLDVLEVEYDLLRQSISAPGSKYPIIVQRFPWLKDILDCWVTMGMQREVPVYRN